MGRFLAPTLSAIGVPVSQATTFGPAFFFGALTVGRLVAGSIKTNAKILFRISAAMGIISIALLMTGSLYPVLAGVVLGGLGFANIWPMLFAITVEERPERASELSGLMCMAISGGALIPLVM